MSGEFTILSLYSGVGGLELGVSAVVANARTVGYVEREAFAAACLLARMEEKSLEPAPVWCDEVERVDLAHLAGGVSCIAAGFPCQPFSQAGSRRGMDDARWGWPHVLECIRRVQPGWVFLENVPGLVRAGLPTLLGDLAACGFDAEWSVVRAAEVGAPHRRERLFVLAHAVGGGCEGQWLAEHPDVEGEHGRQPYGRSDDRQFQRPAVDDPDSERRQQVAASAHGDEGSHERRSSANDNEPASTGAGMAHTERARLQGSASRHAEPAGQRARTQRHLGPRSGDVFPPGPQDPRWSDIGPHLHPALAKDAAESIVRLVADGLAPVVVRDRTDALRATGNGVVPLQAAVAFAELASRLEER